MEYPKQNDILFYADDFQFHISRQGLNDRAIISAFHWHECIEILYCDGGNIQVTIENAEYTMESGDMILIGPDVVHKTFKARYTSGSLYNILFDTSMLQNVISSSLESRCINSFLNYLSNFTHYFTEKNAVPQEMGELIHKLERRYNSDGDFNCIYMRAYLLEIIAKLCEHGLFMVEERALSNQTVEAINRTVEYIQSHCGEKLTLSDMADRANLSYHYYSKLFKRVTGKTFAAYVASARIFKAEKMMIEGKYSLQEIAGMVGLYPQSNFNHTYKRLRGYSPNEFLRRLG